MWFPRAKDRLRYLLRALPAAHEASMFEHCRAEGISVPPVVSVRVLRRLGLPRASMLVTGGLPIQEQEPSPEEVVGAVRRLLDARVFHPDLHAGNFLSLAGGGVAVLDLQSARVRHGGVSSGERQAMFAKLLHPSQGTRAARLGQQLRDQGVCSADQVAHAMAAGAALSRRELAGRIRRCLRESTEFTVRPGLFGTLYRRRTGGSLGEPVEGGGELVRYWIGDRSLEILDSRPPMCRALYCGRWPGGNRLYVGAGGGAALLSAADELHRAHARYQELESS